jgi:hypothetical protein
MKKYVAMSMGLVGSLMISTAVFAADFGALDANQDGSLSAEEAASDPDLSGNWSVIDSDENGVIDQAEFSAFEATMQGDAPAEEAVEAVEPVEGEGEQPAAE